MRRASRRRRFHARRPSISARSTPLPAFGERNRAPYHPWRGGDRVCRGGYARLITVTALVDGALAGHYIADGLVVATPTGSTGYSLSAGGPIISPKVDCMVLTPICAHSLQHRPTVVQGSAQIRLLLGSDAPQSACLQVDGQTYAQLDDGAVVEISRADRTLQLIRTSDQPFFNLVREKLTEWTR